MTRFRNYTGSVLKSSEFGALPPGEFEITGYDPGIHGVIPGCTPLDEAARPAGKTRRKTTDSTSESGEESSA